MFECVLILLMMRLLVVCCVYCGFSAVFECSVFGGPSVVLGVTLLLLLCGAWVFCCV